MKFYNNDLIGLGRYNLSTWPNRTVYTPSCHVLEIRASSQPYITRGTLNEALLFIMPINPTFSLPFVSHAFKHSSSLSIYKKWSNNNFISAIHLEHFSGFHLHISTSKSSMLLLPLIACCVCFLYCRFMYALSMVPMLLQLFHLFSRLPSYIWYIGAWWYVRGCLEGRILPG